MKILIAEDEPVAARLLQRALESFGHEVSLSTNGADAWASFQQDPVRLIVSDWIMPGLDGLQLCQKIRKQANAPYTYFILLTSQDTSLQNYDLAMDAGVDDFLTKPLDRLTIRMRLQVADRILRFTSEVRQLRKLIPLCAWCRKIRNDDNYWQLVESYVTEQTGSEFSHCMCPSCLEELRESLLKVDS